MNRFGNFYIERLIKNSGVYKKCFNELFKDVVLNKTNKCFNCFNPIKEGTMCIICQEHKGD